MQNKLKEIKQIEKEPYRVFWFRFSKETITIIGILLMTLLIQYTSNKLDERQTKIQLETIKQTKNLQMIDYWHNRMTEQYLSLTLLTTDKGSFEVPSASEVKGPLSDEIIQLIERYNKRELSIRDFLSAESRLYVKMYEEKIYEYNQQNETLQKLIIEESNIFSIKFITIKNIAYIIQLFAILFLFVFSIRKAKKGEF